jgi:hypothetical protein
MTHIARTNPFEDENYINEQQFAAARGLIREAQQEAEQERFVELQHTWLDALKYFRKTEKQIGPPTNPNCANMYGYLLNSLRALGQLILSNASDPSTLEYSRIKTALRDLAIADYANEHLSDEDELEIEAAFHG